MTTSSPYFRKLLQAGLAAGDREPVDHDVVARGSCAGPPRPRRTGSAGARRSGSRRSQPVALLAGPVLDQLAHPARGRAPDDDGVLCGRAAAEHRVRVHARVGDDPQARERDQHEQATEHRRHVPAEIRRPAHGRDHDHLDDECGEHRRRRPDRERVPVVLERGQRDHRERHGRVEEHQDRRTASCAEPDRDGRRERQQEQPRCGPERHDDRVEPTPGSTVASP